MKRIQQAVARAGRSAGVLWAAALLGAGLARGADIPGEIMKAGGQRLQGNISWQTVSKVYQVSGGGAQTVVPLNQVASIRVQPPAALEAAAKAVSQGTTTGPAVEALEKIVDDYLMLGPDLTAMRWLAEAYTKSGRGKDAARRFDAVMQNRSAGKLPADVLRAYWTVMLDAERYAELNASLKQAGESGDRPVAASAQMVRGDLNMRRKQFRDALVDGYLRVVVLFKDVRDIQPEALSKASKCFEELGESQNAEKMKRILLQDYPDSPYSK